LCRVCVCLFVLCMCVCVCVCLFCVCVCVCVCVCCVCACKCIRVRAVYSAGIRDGNNVEYTKILPVRVFVRVVQSMLWHRPQANDKGRDLRNLRIWHCQKPNIPSERVREALAARC